MNHDMDFDIWFMSAINESNGSDVLLCAKLVDLYLQDRDAASPNIMLSAMAGCLWAAIEIGSDLYQRTEPKLDNRLDAMIALLSLSSWSMRVKIEGKIIDSVLNEMLVNNEVTAMGGQFVFALLSHRSLWRTRLALISKVLCVAGKTFGLECEPEISRRSLLRRSDLLRDMLGLSPSSAVHMFPGNTYTLDLPPFG